MKQCGKVRGPLSAIATVVRNRLAFESLAHERVELGSCTASKV